MANIESPNQHGKAMSEEEHQDALKATLAFNENRDSSLRGRCESGRGNRTAQRPKADKSEAEADISEITSGGVFFFNAEHRRNFRHVNVE
jgi:hypothetical protein